MRLILNLLAILGLLLMVDYFAKLSFKAYQTPFGRLVIRIQFFQVVSFCVLALLDFLFSFLNRGNFVFASLLDGLLRPFGRHFYASPLFNIFSELGMIWFALLLLYFFIGAVGQWLKLPIKIDKSAQLFSVIVDKEHSLEFPFNQIRDILPFGALVGTSCQLLLFKFVVYKNVPLPDWFMIVLYVVIALALLDLFVYLPTLNELIQMGLIQGIFFDLEAYKKVIYIFQEVLCAGEVSVKKKVVNEKVKLFMEMSIFNFPKNIGGKKFNITISEELLDLYRKYEVKYGDGGQKEG